MTNEKDQPDAGLRSLNHYREKLPKWRYMLRTATLPLVRWETPYLAWFQERIRTPSLDSWFAITANLGTHTFYMIMLPVLFWCGYTEVGRGIVQLLASGVFFSGFLKDLLCLPRPLSPPLTRITMSGSAALEYGFPSTHTTNAVSVVVYLLYVLHSPDSSISPLKNIIFQTILYIFAASIVIGRLYCGMHGFFDIIMGGFLGALLGYIRIVYGPLYDEELFSGSIKIVFAVVVVILALIRIHPEPADSCPCFDDSVAFAGVMMGAEFGNWHFAQTSYPMPSSYPGTIPYELAKVGWIKTILRIILGILMVFLWREIMKPSLHRVLPPIFRVVERLGLNLPRRFFTLASQYEHVPDHLKDDDVIPDVSEIPSILTSIRHPRRRAISIGPQSEADAYEALAYREKRRQESISSDKARSVSGRRLSLFPTTVNRDGSPVRRSPRRLDEYEHMMGTGGTPSPGYAGVENRNLENANANEPRDNAAEYQQRFGTGAEEEDEDEEEMFSKITPPRVRYDVEVVTKLIVYSGIGWLSLEFTPILFQVLGLAP
ncbi:sphingosine-1-phosphate phosphohydrolase [Paracoccidioides lutzii Pb01]|uniref:Sphingosine-1-phosphate phosphohydrolase n=1 Tax=Paracoccidioides lutzii (strain ATCC MYA-826 / Pb01) TaxID=502779 RepID=C1GZE2_PARBA|nr:sphingosine-1-phosphate phosphohydrolase [Paracoccidioides lutzii Pb01]EEH41965.2 sphingosine-1-phosphate phosphohydrolase [Paracoccidioides lutzii Pb01]